MPTVTFNQRGTLYPCDLISRLLKDRIIIISSEIDREITALVISQLLYLQAEDSKKPISLYVNSPGGSVTDGLAIIDTMNILTCPIETYCIGSCASMGAMICTSGTKGKRYILQHSRMMLHSVSCGTDGNINELKLQIKEADNLNNILLSILQKTTNKTRKQLEKDTINDYYLSAKEAIQYGLVDEIITSLNSKKSKSNK